MHEKLFYWVKRHCTNKQTTGIIMKKATTVHKSTHAALQMQVKWTIYMQINEFGACRGKERKRNEQCRSFLSFLQIVTPTRHVHTKLQYRERNLNLEQLPLVCWQRNAHLLFTQSSRIQQQKLANIVNFSQNYITTCTRHRQLITTHSTIINFTISEKKW